MAIPWRSLRQWLKAVNGGEAVGGGGYGGLWWCAWWRWRTVVVLGCEWERVFREVVTLPCGW